MEMDFKIIESGAILEEGTKGWKVEINKVSWYGRDPGWDIRAWNEDHTKCGKGIGLSELALSNLANFVLAKLDATSKE